MTPLDQCQHWVNEFVVGLDLCPWARAPLQSDTVRWRSTQAAQLEALVAEVVFEAEQLQQHHDIETTLLVLAEPAAVLDFDSMNELVAVSEAVLEDLGLLDTVQLVGFHPDFRYAEADPLDPANHTNRSPVPMVHLLRRAALEALQIDGARVSERNAALLRGRASEA
ncbi:MAG: hypothetical protein CL927_09555 [Deltaproteobacteria bacterium]|nr:hypothetical protein [Deltaproteobacteria bacterium]HCH63714.1 DUF1415 domain-containing protein [Deltaproteobacteria bacterium]